MAEATPTRLKRSPCAALLSAIIVLALGFALIIPPFQSNDEHGHFVRVYEISRGHLVGMSAPSLPRNVIDFMARYPERLEDTGGAERLIQADWARPAEPTGETQLGELGPKHRYLKWGVIGANLYCPVTYFPAVIGVWLGRVFSASPLGLVYGARIANVIVFGLVMALAFRLAPQSAALMGVVALMPMTLQQVAVVSADAIVITASFLGFACVLRTRERPVKRGLLIGMAILFPIWVVCKPSPWTFVVVLLISGICFSSWRSRLVYVAALFAAMFVSAVAWQMLSAANTQALRESRIANGIDMTANLHYAFRQPGEFAATVTSAMVRGLPDYARQFWGVFGWSKFSGPWWLRGSYLLLLLFVAAAEQFPNPLSTGERLLAAAVFVCGFLFIHVVIFFTDAHPCQTGSVVRLCFDNSAGIQGRYFIPFGLFGLLALKQSRLKAPQRSLILAVLLAGIVQGALTLELIARRFYS